VPKLDRLARSVPDARQIGDSRPKLTPRQQAHLVALHEDGEHTIAELAELFSVGRSTVYRAIERARTRTAEGKEAAA
jgi:DNA invertase Pin-like site-specific DNA recombinase